MDDATPLTTEKLSAIYIPISSSSTLFASATAVNNVKTSGRYWLWVVIALVSITLGGIVIGKVSDRKEKVATPTPPNGMVYVPGGKFVVGRLSGIDELEKPPHEVNLPDAYFMDKTEVTNEQYWQFIKATSRTPPSHWNAGQPESTVLSLPVVNVTWQDAVAYCQWKGTYDGLICHLPSEHEWEHAARGNNNKLYTWDNTWRSNAANANQPEGKIVAVGSYAQDTSDFGVMDMNGNVREWTNDFMSVYQGSQAKPTPGVRMVRGGAFKDPAENATNTFRTFFPPETKLDFLGFRCVCEISQ
jgi:formylglycine-generating enzyme required for sulfatase activity